MIHRRRFFVAPLALAAPAAFAQDKKPARIVVLSRSPVPELGDFRDQMRALGWVEGRTLIVEEPYAGDSTARLHELAVEVAHGAPDVIVAGHSEAAQAARAATATIPIVFTTSDPVRDGLVASFARPGRNLTGLSQGDFELSAKRVEVIRDAFPALGSVAILHTSSASSTRQFEASRRAATALRIEGVGVEIDSEAALAPAIEAALRGGAQGIVVNTSPLFRTLGATIAVLAARFRVPAIYENAATVEAGGLMSYGPDWRRIYLRMAVLVDRILKGAKPGDIPVERWDRFELVINLRTAAALGLTISPALVALADRVIE